MAFEKACWASRSGNWGEKSGFHIILEHKGSDIFTTTGRERHVISMNVIA